MKRKLLSLLNAMFPFAFLGTFACNSGANNSETNSQLLAKATYNDVVSNLNKKPHDMAVAIIYGKNQDVQYFSVENGKSLWYYLKTKLKKYAFKYKDVPYLGAWLGPMYNKSNPQTLIRGTSKNWNYGMQGYPMIYYNHKFAQLGVSNYFPEKGEIIEITYNHES